MRPWRKETTACQEATEACLRNKESSSLEVEPVAVHEEVPKEETAVKPIGTLMKRYGDRHLAVRRRVQSKKRTQGNGGSRKKLAAACRGKRDDPRNAIIQDRRSNREDGKKRTRGNVARGTSKRRTFGQRCRATPEGVTGIRNQGSRQQLHLRKERTTGNGIRGRSRSHV
jgi:hypothetical protein